MDGASTVSLDQWGTLSWDEEFEELCTNPLPTDDSRPPAPTADITVNSISKLSRALRSAHCNAHDQNARDQPVDDHLGQYHEPNANETHLFLDEKQLADKRYAPNNSNESKGDNCSRIPLPTRKPTARKLATGHPGWSNSLSPSISTAHSTPPELNRWIFSEEILISLDAILADQEQSPRRAAVILSALIHTDDEDFSAYCFPYGATGLKTLDLKQRNYNPFARRNSERKRTSYLSHSETVTYTNRDNFDEGAEGDQGLGVKVGSDALKLPEDDEGKDESLMLDTVSALPGFHVVDDLLERNNRPSPIDLNDAFDFSERSSASNQLHEQLQGRSCKAPGQSETQGDELIEQVLGLDNQELSEYGFASHFQARELSANDIEALSDWVSDPDSCQDTSCSNEQHHDFNQNHDANTHRSDANQLNPTIIPASHWIPSDHPGWTLELSPSLSSRHATAPEINRWAKSVPIMHSINYELNQGDENLRRGTILWAALLHTDTFDFTGYQYPYGAMGCKRFPPKARRHVGRLQNSLLRFSESSLESSDMDSHPTPIYLPLQPVQVHKTNGPKISEEKPNKQRVVLSQQDSVHLKQENLDLSRTEKHPTQGEYVPKLSSLVQRKRNEKALALAMNTELPGIDFIEEYVEKSEKPYAKPLDILAALTDDLETAGVYMQEKLENFEKVAEWVEQVADSAAPGEGFEDDMEQFDETPCASLRGVITHPALGLDSWNMQMVKKLENFEAVTGLEDQVVEAKSGKAAIHKQKKEDSELGMSTNKTQESEQPSLISMVLKSGGFLRDFWNGHPLALD